MKYTIIALLLLFAACTKNTTEAFKSAHPEAPERIGRCFPEYKALAPGTVWVRDGKRIVVHITFTTVQDECSMAYGVFKPDGTLLSAQYE